MASESEALNALFECTESDPTGGRMLKANVTVGAVTASNNVAQINGNTVDVSNGVAGLGTIRVAVAGDADNAAQVNLNPGYIGGRAEDTAALPTFTAGDAVGARFDKATGRLLVSQVPLTAADVITAKIDQTNPGVSNVTASIPMVSAAITYAPSADDSAALEASSVSKASAGVLHRVVITNSKGTGQFFQVHNAAALPADTAVPAITMYVAATSTITLDLGVYGKYFSTGIVWCNSSTLATKTIGSADMWVNVLYK